MSKFELSIFDPNTLLPHRAGIAGLALVLSTLEIDDAPISWEITEDTVTLNWDCSDKEAISWLMSQTYTVQDGLLVIPPLHISAQGRYPLSKSILDTFLQFQRGNKEFSKEEQNLVFSIDDGEKVVKNRPLLWCYYTDPNKLDAFTAKGILKDKISISGKHLPGLIQDFANSQYYQESPSRFLTLLFLPISCTYFRLPFVKAKILKKERMVPTYAVIIPEVRNLQNWVNRRRQLSETSYKDFHSCSSSESALRFLMRENLFDGLEKQAIRYCEVIKIAPQSWDENQAGLKKDIHRVRLNNDSISLYTSACQYLPPTRVSRPKDAQSKKRTLVFSKVLAWIADNLVIGKPWYTDFSSFCKKKTEDEVSLANGSRKKVELYKFERKGLTAMTEHLQPFEQILFDTVRGAFGNYLRKQFDFRKSKLGRDLNLKERLDEFDSATDKVIYRLQRPSTQQEFAKAIVDFLSQFRSKAARGFGREIYAWIHGEEWRKARDLTMLAIATYQSKKKDGDANSEEELVEIPDSDSVVEADDEGYEESL